MNKMVGFGALIAISLGLSGMSRPPSVEPDALRMAAVAYATPLPRIKKAVAVLQRDFRVAHADIPQALGLLAHCGKNGMMEFPDLVDAVSATGQAWNASMHNEDLERVFNIRRDGLEDVQRLCRSLEVARRGHGSSRDTTASMVAVLRSYDDQAVVARTLINEMDLDEVDGIGEIRRDYRARLDVDA